MIWAESNEVDAVWAEVRGISLGKRLEPIRVELSQIRLIEWSELLLIWAMNKLHDRFKVKLGWKIQLRSCVNPS